MFMEQLNNGSIVFLGGICMSTDMYIGQKKDENQTGRTPVQSRRFENENVGQDVQ